MHERNWFKYHRHHSGTSFSHKQKSPQLLHNYLFIEFLNPFRILSLTFDHNILLSVILWAFQVLGLHFLNKFFVSHYQNFFFFIIKKVKRCFISSIILTKSRFSLRFQAFNAKDKIYLCDEYQCCMNDLLLQSYMHQLNLPFPFFLSIDTFFM